MIMIRVKIIRLVVIVKGVFIIMGVSYFGNSIYFEFDLVLNLYVCLFLIHMIVVIDCLILSKMVIFIVFVRNFS